MRYYLDTSIWLNLFKNEGDSTKGIPYWQLAKEFIEFVMFSKEDEIVYSSIVLRELQIKFGEEVYQEKKRYLEDELKFIFVNVINEDKINARKMESHYNYNISFYDLLHISIAKRLNLILVTRDKQMLEIARENGVVANRPEEL